MTSAENNSENQQGNAEDYGADSIKVLRGLDAVRKLACISVIQMMVWSPSYGL